jgi:hypothetical protein
MVEQQRTHLFTLVCDEIANRPVIGLFPGGGEETAGDLTLLLVIFDAFAAVAALVARHIGAGAMVLARGSYTFHIYSS